MSIFFKRVGQGSLNYLFWGDQTMQIYGNFEGFPLYKRIVWVGNIMTPVGSATAVGSMTPVGSTTNSIRKINP